MAVDREEVVSQDTAEVVLPPFKVTLGAIVGADSGAGTTVQAEVESTMEAEVEVRLGAVNESETEALDTDSTVGAKVDMVAETKSAQTGTTETDDADDDSDAATEGAERGAKVRADTISKIALSPSTHLVSDSGLDSS